MDEITSEECEFIVGEKTSNASRGSGATPGFGIAGSHFKGERVTLNYCYRPSTLFFYPRDCKQ